MFLGVGEAVTSMIPSWKAIIFEAGSGWNVAVDVVGGGVLPTQ